MLLTISTTHIPATDLGYLLAKNPARVQQFEVGGGTAHVFYPEVSAARCTAALLMDIDPVGLVRGRGERDGPLDQYVNDRPYVASSLLSVALLAVFGSALNGRCRERPELAKTAIPLTARVSVMARGGEELIRRLFAPLGYAVALEPIALDEQFPEWGDGQLFHLTLRGTARLSDLLTHLYVLIPVLDSEKHYYVGDDEVEKLLRRGDGWLATHPERDLIAQRYLKSRRLVRAALDRLTDPSDDDDAATVRRDERELGIERPLSLHQQRLGAVLAALKGAGARRVLDLGCGEGRLLQLLLDEPQFEQIVGMDISHRALEIATERLRLERMPPLRRQRIALLQGALTYRDVRLDGYDAAAAVEVIEHLDGARLAAFAQSLFGAARPGTVVLTTPNAEYNVRFATLPAGQLRHRDHRFEWTRSELAAWGDDVAARYGYRVRYLPIGPLDDEVGAPSQMAIFAR